MSVEGLESHEMDDDEVDDMSYRERLTRAKKLHSAAKGASLDEAAAHLKSALRFLYDVDEDSPKEAQELRAAVLGASSRVFEQLGAIQVVQTAARATPLAEPSLSAAQAGHALRQAGQGSQAAGDVEVAPAVLEQLARCVADAAGAGDFHDAGGLPPLLQLCSCSRSEEATLYALNAVHAFSSVRSMVLAIFSAAQLNGSSNDGLWWLRRAVHVANPSSRDLCLKIISNMSDIRDLDVKQQSMVHAALRNALVHQACPSGARSPSTLLQEIEKLLLLSADEGKPDLHLGLLVCTCIRNLARDGEMRCHFEPLMPVMVRLCAISQAACYKTCPTAKTKAEGVASEAETKHSRSLLLVAIEALINCMSNSPNNRAELLNSSHSIVCRFSGAKWGLGLKNLQPPLVLTRVDASSEAAMCGLIPGDIIVRINEHVDYGPSLPHLQQALRQGGAAEVQLQRTGVVVLAGERICPWHRATVLLRILAACDLTMIQGFSALNI